MNAPTPMPTLQRQLIEARARTLALVCDLAGEQLLGPRLAIVNPPLWEIGHLGWFQERWCLRTNGAEPLRSSMLEGADRLYDSSVVAHDTRWDLPLPSLDATLQYLRAVLERVLEKLERDSSATMRYFAQLCALHEEMHCEAFSYTRQTLGYRAPQPQPGPCDDTAPAIAGDAHIAGGEFMLGASDDGRFVFDNEKWAHPVNVEPFAISRTCVTNAEFAAFVEDGGYERESLWTHDGWRWRGGCGASHPVYWRRDGGTWYVRAYDEWQPLQPQVAVLHVNAHEANAYCRWAGRRLPSEAEWEYAAATAPGDSLKRRYPWGDEVPDDSRAGLYGATSRPVSVAAYPAGDSAWGCRQMIGNVWEWTQESFAPYPGFVADPYEDYSQPWFGTHTVLRGGSFATRASLIRNTWRNFYTPERRDVYAGFRTCA